MRARAVLLLALACAGGAAHAGGDEPFRLRPDPRLSESHAADTEGRPVFARGRGADGRMGRELTLEGDAELRRAGTVVTGDRLTYWETDDEVTAVGSVRLYRQGNVFTGPELQLKADAGEGYFRSPSYFLGRYAGRGSAERVEFLGPDRFAIADGTYTTCRAADPDWYVRARRMTFDETEGEGEGRDGSVVFKQRSILWAPWFSFPLGEDRRSGFLAPTLSFTTTSGPEILLPYYVNIAPNRDFTLYNRLMSKRGVQVGGWLRYIEPNASGETRFEYNPQDAVSGTSRSFWWTQHAFTGWYGWNGGWNAKGVSDDNYFVDYARSIVNSAERALPRDVTLSRSVADWGLMIKVQRFQNILDARGAPPYERLPQLMLTNTKSFGGFVLNNVFDATVFTRPLANSPEGARFFANPALSYPIRRPGWFVTPKVGLHAASYQLEANGSNGNEAQTLNRTIPTFSVDAGLLFDRRVALLGKDRIQTLEPRLFYVRTPYRDQTAFPVFDTAEVDFSFAQLFNENRFLGNDRIGDANQLTTALLTRLINPASGIEDLRLAFGQRYYFADQRVQIPGVASRTDTKSDLLFAIGGNIGADLSMDAGVQYSVADHSLPRGTTSVRWRPPDGRIVNVNLRYLRDEYGQLDTSWRLPLWGRWTALGRSNYSFLRERRDAATGQMVPAARGVVEGLAGFEYREDCWAFRFVVQRFVSAAATTTSQFFLQLELSGLGRLGSNPLDILQRNIPGYRLPTDRPPVPSRYYGYE